MRAKKVLSYIAISLVIILIVGGLGYLTNGYRDWQFWNKGIFPVTYQLDDFEIIEDESSIINPYLMSNEEGVYWGLDDIYTNNQAITILIESESLGLEDDYILSYDGINETDYITCRTARFELDEDEYFFRFALVDYEDVDLEYMIDEELDMIFKFENGSYFYFLTSFSNSELEDIKFTLSIIDLEVLEIDDLDISDDYVMSWSENVNVKEYKIIVDDITYTVKDVNLFNLEPLIIEGVNEVTIQAIAYANSEYTDSEIEELEVEYVVEEEVELVINLADLVITDGTENKSMSFSYVDSNLEVLEISPIISYLHIDASFISPPVYLIYNMGSEEVLIDDEFLVGSNEILLFVADSAYTILYCDDINTVVVDGNITFTYDEVEYTILDVLVAAQD